MAYSALLLLMLGILANHHYMALALDDLALFADFLHRRSDFHKDTSFVRRAHGNWGLWSGQAPLIWYAK